MPTKVPALPTPEIVVSSKQEESSEKSYSVISQSGFLTPAVQVKQAEAPQLPEVKPIFQTLRPQVEQKPQIKNDKEELKKESLKFLHQKSEGTEKIKNI